MNKDEILKDISSLIQDIDECTGEYIKVIKSHTADIHDSAEFRKTIDQISRLMVMAHQELSFLYDYIKDEENSNTEYTNTTDCGQAKAVEYFSN